MSAEIRQPPLDWITSIAYSPLSTKNILGVASWDKKFRLYDTDSNALAAISEFTAPLLDCAFAGESEKIIVGGIDKAVTLFDVIKGGTTLIGKHDEPVKIVCYHPETRLVFSGGWDRCLKAWDLRNSTQQPVAISQLTGKCFCMDISSENLVAADSYKRVYIYDLKNIMTAFHPHDQRDQILKYQMRCLRCFPDNKGFAISSIEGRVAWELFDLDPTVQTSKFTFKCHRTKDEAGIETVYPVNALAFHPEFGTFVTGGSDGGVSVWDGLHRKRLWRLPSFSTGVTCAAFNTPGTQLAIALSNTMEHTSHEEEKNNNNINNNKMQTPQIIFRHIKEEDVRPKSRPFETS